MSALVWCALWAGLSALSFWLMDPASALLTTVLAAILIIASAIDWRTFILPDVFTIPLALGGLGLAAISGDPPFLDALVGAVCGYGSFWLISTLYERLRGHPGLGLGDAKLMAAAGAWCGVLALPSVVLIGAVSALAYVAMRAVSGHAVTGKLMLPFGPFLSLGFFAVWVLMRTETYLVFSFQ